MPRRKWKPRPPQKVRQKRGQTEEEKKIETALKFGWGCLILQKTVSVSESVPRITVKLRLPVPEQKFAPTFPRNALQQHAPIPLHIPQNPFEQMREMRERRAKIEGDRRELFRKAEMRRLNDHMRDICNWYACASRLISEESSRSRAINYIRTANTDLASFERHYLRKEIPTEVIEAYSLAKRWRTRFKKKSDTPVLVEKIDPSVSSSPRALRRKAIVSPTDVTTDPYASPPRNAVCYDALRLRINTSHNTREVCKPEGGWFE